MNPRAYSLASCSLLIAALSVLLLLTGASCGRSNLDDFNPADGGRAEGGGFDGGPDADAGPDVLVTCDVTTCPRGCCDPSGTCQPGTSLSACGLFGQSCANCPAQGFKVCDARTQACANPQTQCGPQSCKGCCEGNLCLGGGDPNECGLAGQACQHCAAQGLACQPSPGGLQCVRPTCGPQNCNGCCAGDRCIGGVDLTQCGQFGQQCQNCAAVGASCVAQPGAGGACRVQPFCSPQNCKGCCAGNVCLTGVDLTQCGQFGQQCQNCAVIGESCVPQPGAGGACRIQAACGPQNCAGCCVGNACIDGSEDTTCGFGGSQCQNCQTVNGVCLGQKCVPRPPQCGPQNCPTGCCAGDVCAVGTQDIDCGRGGQQCQSCAAVNQVCTNQTCVPRAQTCTPQNCPGCCDQTQACQPGFLDTQCGQLGAACANCVQIGSTCETNVTPRVCNSQQTQCPAPYPACPASVTTPVLPILHVCSASDLANARAACSGGAATPSCQAFLSFELQVNPSCGKCLQPFDVDFNQFSGLFACVAPFVSPDCDHKTGCVVDCESASCAQCDPASVQQCRNDARNGQCAPYFQQASCVFPAFGGAGAFCNPNNYGGNYGAWLQGVGGHYCGP